MPAERLGPSSAACFGGWAGIRAVGRVPVMHPDVRHEYQTIFLLQQLQDFLFAERLRFVDDTEAVRRFVENRLPSMIALSLGVSPGSSSYSLLGKAGRGNALIGRWAFRMNDRGAPEHFRLCMAPLWSDGAWFFALLMSSPRRFSAPGHLISFGPNSSRRKAVSACARRVSSALRLIQPKTNSSRCLAGRRAAKSGAQALRQNTGIDTGRPLCPA